MKKLIELYKKYKEIFWYLAVGGLTTVISIGTYMLFARVCGLSTVLSNVLSWVCAVTFAFFANKLLVFESRVGGIKAFFYEMLLFYLARVATGALDTGLMWLFVDIVGVDELLMKILTNVIVLVTNYIFSKLFIFRKKTADKSEEESEE